MSFEEDKKKSQEHILAKRDKYDQQGFADKDYQFTLDGKTVKLWLPSSVFAQQSLLSLGSRVVHDQFADFEEETKLTEKYYKIICSHMQIDGKPVNPELLELANLQAYALTYWAELLYPLSLWSDAKAKKALLTSND